MNFFGLEPPYKENIVETIHQQILSMEANLESIEEERVSIWLAQIRRLRKVIKYAVLDEHYDNDSEIQAKLDALHLLVLQSFLALIGFDTGSDLQSLEQYVIDLEKRVPSDATETAVLRGGDGNNLANLIFLKTMEMQMTIARENTLPLPAKGNYCYELMCLSQGPLVSIGHLFARLLAAQTKEDVSKIIDSFSVGNVFKTGVLSNPQAFISDLWVQKIVQGIHGVKEEQRTERIEQTVIIVTDEQVASGLTLRVLLTELKNKLGEWADKLMSRVVLETPYAVYKYDNEEEYHAWYPDSKTNSPVEQSSIKIRK